MFSIQLNRSRSMFHSKMILRILGRDIQVNIVCFALILFSVYLLLPSVLSHTAKVPPLLVVSFDGFRWDYLSRTPTPNFHRVISNGVHATRGLKNVFTTSTLTNHWSMVTGLYAESHGIIENDMFDPVINETYIPLYKKKAKYVINDPRYYDVPGVEPIWVANQLQKEHGRTGSIMWWGAENAVKYVRPTYHMPFSRKVNTTYKINTMVNWFVNDYPINLGLLWFQNPDHISHKCGPDSDNVTRAIAEADRLLGVLLHELEKADILDDFNLIVTADHGHAATSRERLIHLDSIIDPSTYKMLHYTPVASIIPHPGFEDVIFQNLSKAAPTNHFTVYKKEDIPERLHYKNNRRTPPIVAFADNTWSFISQMPDENFTLAGTHGYDNKYDEMHPIFMAMGPSFKSNYKIDTFDSINIYALLCHLLHLKPNPNNGTLTTVSKLLASHENTVWTFGTYILCVIVIASVGGVFIVAACRQHRFLKRKLGQLKVSSFGSSKSSLIADNGSTVKLLSDDDDEDL